MVETVTVCTKDGDIEIPVTDARIQAYRALDAAANRIAKNNAQSYMNDIRVRFKRGKFMGGYYISESHKAIVEAMPKVLSGEITPEEAMGLLRGYDIENERFGKSN